MNWKKYLFLIVLLPAAVMVSCSGSKNTPYYRVQLTKYEDYTEKFSKIIDYLKNFDDDTETVCNTVVPDLVVFEDDITREIDEDDFLTPYQLDTLDLMLRQTRALRRFMDCIAKCSDFPTIYSNELDMVAQLLDFEKNTINSSQCGKAVEMKKERFLHYFVINTTQRDRTLQYAYNTFYGESDSGSHYLKAQEGAAVYGIFNDYSNDWIIMRSLLCN